MVICRSPYTMAVFLVAIKIMDVSQIKEEYVVKNLYREARIMSQLQHPCIAALFQTMQNGNVYYIVSELAGGGDLCTFIKNQKNGKLEERQTKVFARQLMSAVAHMHSIGIVHRDLKMENVMLNSLQTQIKIVDFGLSNVFSPDNPLRTHCGSPEYAAPELFVAGKSYGPEVDLWSFDNNQRTHSAKIANDKYNFDQNQKHFRPLTGPPLKFVNPQDRSVKRRSLLPVMKTQSTPTKGVTTITSALINQRNTALTMSKASTATIKKLNLARGDIPGGTIKTSANFKSPNVLKNFLNEPIARSIAGYVVNNIPEKLQYLKLIKSQPGENVLKK